jgi:hypothetical protein
MMDSRNIDLNGRLVFLGKTLRGFKLSRDVILQLAKDVAHPAISAEYANKEE